MNLFCGMGVHRWAVVSDNGKSVEEECTRCGKRRIWQRKGGYQPVTLQNNKEETRWNIPKRR